MMYSDEKCEHCGIRLQNMSYGCPICFRKKYVLDKDGQFIKGFYHKTPDWVYNKVIIK